MDIVQAEAAAKRQRHIEYLVKSSRLPQPLKLLADFDFDFQPKLNRKLIMDLASLGFIERNESILFIGDNGTGKSHLARAWPCWPARVDTKPITPPAVN